jgi:hypothetical protein
MVSIRKPPSPLPGLDGVGRHPVRIRIDQDCYRIESAANLRLQGNTQDESASLAARIPDSKISVSLTIQIERAQMLQEAFIGIPFAYEKQRSPDAARRH